MILNYVSKKINLSRTLLTQVLFVLLAFIIMVALSYAFTSAIVRGNLVRDANGVLDVAQTRISSRLKEFELAIGSFAEETRGMLMQGDGADALRVYIENLSHFTFLDGGKASGIQNCYGYFETLPGGPVFIVGNRRSLPQEAEPEKSDWYRLAVEAGGRIVETPPTGAGANGTQYTYAKSILDDQGRRLGVVRMDVKIDDIGQEIVSTALNQGGYGMMMNRDLVMMFHPNPGFVGIKMDDPTVPIHIFANDLRNGKPVFEHPLTSYKNEESVAFFRKLSNGWHLGLVTPEQQYYATMDNMAITLVLLGLSLATILIGILVRIDTARERSDDENKKKSMFLANMSHEIRTPLNAVVGLSELALDGDQLEDDTRDKLAKIHASGMTILSIVNDILDISKLESGKFEICPTEYDTPSLINDIVTFSVVRIGEKLLTFNIDVDENLPNRLYGDDLRVKQIFNNLLSNAFKYTNAGTVEWRVSFERDGDAVWLVSSVRDTGIGIRPEDMQKLFTDYNQVDKQANRKVQGTGLGLAITKHLVEMMDGTVTIESEYGQGTAFHVRLRQAFVSEVPIGKEIVQNLKDMSYTVSKRINAQLAALDLSYAHVLVVDDIATNLDVVKGMMKPYGIKVDCAISGQQAIGMIRTESPHYSAIFMDHMMPDMDGIEATRIIREEIGTDYARNVPVIALTANAIVGNREMFLSQGFQDFISKPIDMVKLDAALRHWVRDKDLEKDLLSAEESPGTETLSFGNRTSMLNILTLDGLDTQKALKRFGGDETVLFHVLRSYATNTRPLLASLKGYLEAGNLEDYEIIVHGLKGSSYGIFAEEVGKTAEVLEMAAKARDFDAVKTGHPGFEKLAETLINDIRKAFDIFDVVADKPVAAEPDPALLQELCEACGAFDMDRVDAAMERLESFRYEHGGQQIAWLREQVNTMAFEKVFSREWPSE